MSVKTKIRSLIEAANAETGKGDTDLTTAVQSLISESGGTSDHRQLTNRDAANQHPITAITGLQTALDGKADAADIPSLEGYATEAYVQNYHDNTKQDIITDLATIRSGASKGATAVQPEAGKGLFSGDYDDLTNKPTIPTAYDDTEVRQRIGAIEAKESTWDAKLNASELPTAINTALAQAKASGEFDGAGGKDGKTAYQYAVEGGYTGTETEFAAKLAKELPDKIPNPNALTFTGAVTGSYDGSAAMTVNIPSAVTDAHINSLIDTKLGVIENGAY